MKKILLLVFLPYCTFAQDDWQKFSFDRNVECRFPGKPEIQPDEFYTMATYDLPGVKFSFAKFNRDSTIHIADFGELKKLYKANLETVVNTVNGVASDSYYRIDRGMLMGGVRYKIPATGVDCECRLLFVKNSMYNFTICGTEGNFEYGEMNKAFLGSIKVYNVISVDQLTEDPVSPFWSAFVATIIFWSITLVAWIVLIAMGGSRLRGSDVLRKMFTIVRWAFVASSATMAIVVTAGTIRNALSGDADTSVSIVFGALFLGLAGAGVYHNPVSPKRVS